MTGRLGRLLQGIAIFLVSSSAALAARPIDRVIAYEDSARTGYEKFSGANMEGATIRPKVLLPSQKNDTLLGEEVGRVVRNCSTAQYRCVLVWSRVFAVPRARLSPTAAYSVAGALLKVEDCLRGDAAVCQVAIISADCQQISGEFCEKVAEGREKSRKPGPIVYFIYNEDVGITAYGVADQLVKTKEERLNVASQMILQGQRGILFDDR